MDSPFRSFATLSKEIVPIAGDDRLSPPPHPSFQQSLAPIQSHKPPTGRLEELKIELSYGQAPFQLVLAASLLRLLSITYAENCHSTYRS